MKPAGKVCILSVPGAYEDNCLLLLLLLAQVTDVCVTCVLKV